MKKSFQQLKKIQIGKCFLCDIDDYSVLDCHRVLHGGQYNDFNTLILCSNCHRKLHAGQYKILGKFKTSKGNRKIVHYINEACKECWKYE